MKFGMRKPSLKKSFKARTTGRIKRKIKKAVIPFYGKKGVGFIKNPKKAIYNKIYRKTTFSPFELADGIGGLLLGLIVLPFWLVYILIKTPLSLLNRTSTRDVQQSTPITIAPMNQEEKEKNWGLWSITCAVASALSIGWGFYLYFQANSEGSNWYYRILLGAALAVAAIVFSVRQRHLEKTRKEELEAQKEAERQAQRELWDWRE